MLQIAGSGSCLDCNITIELVAVITEVNFQAADSTVILLYT